MKQPTAHKASIVVVDDEENMGKILERVLVMEGYHVTAFSDPRRALEFIQRTPPDLVLTDMRMPEISGMELLNETRKANPHTNVIMMTAYASVEKAVEAMRAGAFDYVTKPFKTDELIMTITKAIQNTRLLEENEVLSDTLRRQGGIGSDLVGTSDAIRDARSIIAKAAPSDSAVLVRGESGTGKELAAKSIHHLSPRGRRRYVAINCAGIPENLMESELFGHEKGAFTGADRTKMGLVELAHGGTLFLDEIGELPLALQAKLLRVLQEREIQRVGGLHPIPVDIRLIAATNRDLKAGMEAKQFREDLFYRLNVIEIVMPPLRDRKGDVPVLADFFVSKLSQRMNRRLALISDEAMDALCRYRFPGNVRELENVIERALVLCEGEQIELEDIPADIRRAVEFGTSLDGDTETISAGSASGGEVQDYRVARDDFEREYLSRAVAAAKGNISEAARVTGLSRRHFYEKLEKLGIRGDR